jgi:hypothetical protein
MHPSRIPTPRNRGAYELSMRSRSGNIRLTFLEGPRGWP